MAPARSSTTRHWYDQEAGSDRYDLSELSLSRNERIGSPVPSLARTLVKRTVLLAAVLGLGWLGLQNPDKVQALWSTLAASATELIEAASPSDKAPPRPPAGTRDADPKMTAVDSGLPPVNPPAPEPAAITEVAVAPSIVTGSLPDDKADASAAAPEPLPKPVATDALEKRAEAAGLHPGLSRVLLQRLTDADYRNAKTAIDTALAETDDEGEHIFPKKREAGLALFRVHFVNGAGDSCRRYVVTIAKDGWLTTALPMERCGVKRRNARKE